AGHDRDDEPDRPGLQRVAQRRPERRRRHLVEQRGHDLGKRRQVIRRDEADPRHDLEQERKSDEAAKTLQPNKSAGREPGPHFGRLCRWHGDCSSGYCGSSVATSAFLLISPLASMSSAIAWAETRLNCGGHMGRMILPAISAEMRV